MKTIWYFLLSALCITGIVIYGWSNFWIQILWENIFVSALIFSVILTILNIFIWTIIRILTLPLNFLTLGLFSLVVTFFMIYLTDSFYDNIVIKNIIWYIIIAIIPVLVGFMVGKK